MAGVKKKSLVQRCRMYEFTGDNLPDGHEFPTEDILFQALESNDFSRLNACTVLAYSPEQDFRLENDQPRHICFRDDIWTNRYVRTNVGERLRGVNFTLISSTALRLEVKIISACFLWVTGRTATTHSLLRKCANIVLAARVIESLGYTSLFKLRVPFILNAFIAKIRSPDDKGRIRSERTLRNYFQDLSDLALLGHTRLREMGYSLDIMFNDYAGEDDSNQTYCMPFRLMIQIWSGLISELDAEINDFNYDDLSRIVAINNGYFDSPYYACASKHNHGKDTAVRGDYRTAYYYNMVQAEIQLLYRNINPNMRDWFLVASNKRWAHDFIGIDNRKLSHWHLGLTQKVMFAIQAMSGMRQTEVLGILHGSLIYDGDVLGLKSVLLKFAPEGGKHEDWVVCRYIEKPFLHLRRVNQILTGLSYDELDHLPVSLNMRTWIARRNLKFMSTQRQSEWARDFVVRHHLTVTQDDLHEFRLLNPNIRDSARVSKDIIPGEYWPLRTHQFRRSLAVHLRRLDLISTSDLIRQFKHFAWSMTEWYMSGAVGATHFSRSVPAAFAAELERTELEQSAARAVAFQYEGKLAGEGGRLLMSQRQSQPHLMTFPSLKKAMSMARRGGHKLVSLGNGFYCMNGNECEFRSVIQSSSCNPVCPNMLAGEDSLPVWKRRLAHYSRLIDVATQNNASQADLDFLCLERDFYANAIRFFEEEKT